MSWRSLPNEVDIVEVGPRDGLQNEKATLTAADKITLIENLEKAGLKTIEAGAFVSPKWVPQMAGTAEVLAGLTPKNGVDYPVLVPNMKGLELAREHGVKEIAVFTAASETFNKKNINAGIDESFERLEPVIKAAKSANMQVRGYVSCVAGCPYEGQIDPQTVADVTVRLLELECYEVSLGDTIGVGTPQVIETMLHAVMNRGIGADKLAAHFHDTYGQALANLLVALEMGVHTVDAAVGGLGGCPYAPGAGGNVATEDVVYMLNGCGVETGVDLEVLVDTALDISEKIGRPPVSKVAQAMKAKKCASS